MDVMSEVGSGSARLPSRRKTYDPPSAEAPCSGSTSCARAYHHRKAEYLARAGQTETEDQERIRAEAKLPSTPLDHFLLGEEHYRLGNGTLAIASFENALQLRPDHFWACYYLGLCWLKAQRPDQAVTCLTSCLGQRREFPWLYLLRASAWAEQGQFARAESDFETALQSSLPESARYGLLINRGVMRIRQGRLDSAGVDLRAAVALRPQQYQGYLNLAQAHLSGLQWDKALEQLNQAVRLEPGLAVLYRTRARLQLLRHEPGAALADLNEAIRRETNPTLPARMEDYLDRGRILHAKRDDAGALEACDIVLGQLPHDARACRLRTEALVGLDRLPEALQSLDDCVKFGASEPGVFRARAALRTQMAQYPGAQADYTRAIELEPDAATYVARGWCYLVAGAPKLGMPDFEEALRLAPDLGDAYAGRGYGRALMGQHLLAIADAEAALKHGPESPRLCYNVARIYAQAVARFDRQAMYTGASVESPRGDWEERAVRALTRSLELQSAADAKSFWKGVVDADKALDSIRRGSKFARLAEGYPAPMVNPPRQD